MTTLGTGSFGTVVEYEEYALKIHSDYMSVTECIILFTLNHENVLSAVDYLKKGDKDLFSISYVLELCHCSLMTVFKDFTLAQVLCAKHQCRSGLDYLHKMGYVHGDVGLSNFLVKGLLIKISDFGLSFRTDSSRLVSSKSMYTMVYRPHANILGTTNVYDKTSDLWALQVCFFEMDRKETMLAYVAKKSYPNTELWDLTSLTKGCEPRRITRYIVIGEIKVGPENGPRFEFNDLYLFHKRIMVLYYRTVYPYDLAFREYVERDYDPIITDSHRPSVSEELRSLFPLISKSGLDRLTNRIRGGICRYIDDELFVALKGVIDGAQRLRIYGQTSPRESIVESSTTSVAEIQMTDVDDAVRVDVCRLLDDAS
jgi:serine/threonine protein kinase